MKNLRKRFFAGLWALNLLCSIFYSSYPVFAAESSVPTWDTEEVQGIEDDYSDGEIEKDLSEKAGTEEDETLDSEEIDTFADEMEVTELSDLEETYEEVPATDELNAADTAEESVPLLEMDESDLVHEAEKTVPVFEKAEDGFNEPEAKEIVKRTLTLPAWLDQTAEAAGINLSETLQEALKAKLDVA
ncbi:MAG: hypothetical protein IJ679_10165 [Lachnospiraceae bacterium]|nr:hypothetical protein [Lachnospiraceae bacterium]